MAAPQKANVKAIRAKHSTTFNELYPSQSFHLDETVTVGKIVSSSLVEGLYRKRSAFYFGRSSNLRSDWDSGYESASLHIYTANANALAVETRVEVAFHSGSSDSFNTGRGRRDSSPPVYEGSTWKYEDYETLTEWTEQTGSSKLSLYVDSDNVTTDCDISANVTTQWSESMYNSTLNFVTVNLHSDDEDDAKRRGEIEYYSSKTHTIYQPTLLIFTQSTAIYSTGSSNAVDINKDYVVYNKNLKSSYPSGSTPSFEIGARLLYPSSSYSTTSVAETVQYLPKTTYYNFKDISADEYILPWFMQDKLVLNADSEGHYTDVIDTSLFYPGRSYQLCVKVVSGSVQHIHDLPETFTITD